MEILRYFYISLYKKLLFWKSYFSGIVCTFIISKYTSTILFTFDFIRLLWFLIFKFFFGCFFFIFYLNRRWWVTIGCRSKARRYHFIFRFACCHLKNVCEFGEKWSSIFWSNVQKMANNLLDGVGVQDAVCKSNYKKSNT